ncbi:MAG: hypothetical protein ACI30N_04800 [Muribaculaceae bacterium]
MKNLFKIIMMSMAVLIMTAGAEPVNAWSFKIPRVPKVSLPKVPQMRVSSVIPTPKINTRVPAIYTKRLSQYRLNAFDTKIQHVVIPPVRKNYALPALAAAAANAVQRADTIGENRSELLKLTLAKCPRLFPAVTANNN